MNNLELRSPEIYAETATSVMPPLELVAETTHPVDTPSIETSVGSPPVAQKFAKLLARLRPNDGAESAPSYIYDSEAADKLESTGFVKVAPLFLEQVKDESRTNILEYEASEMALWNGEAEPKLIREKTEHQSLVGLQDFLERAASMETESGSNEMKRSKKNAADMLGSLTYIGEKEFAEASRGIGEYWKQYLDSDPQRQLCILTKITESASKRKSDAYLFDRVIETFSDEDREKYTGRIVRGLKDVTADPKKTKVVLLDDWTISGGQLKTAYNNLAVEPEFKKLAKSVEINLLTASKGRITNGLPTMERGMPSIPIRAYYQSHHSDNSTTPQEGRVSGSHSSVDFDFETDINDMLTELNKVSEANGQPAELMPPPTNIVRTYSYSPAKFVLDKHGTFVPNPAAKEPNSELK